MPESLNLCSSLYKMDDFFATDYDFKKKKNPKTTSIKFSRVYVIFDVFRRNNVSALDNYIRLYMQASFTVSSFHI